MPGEAVFDRMLAPQPGDEATARGQFDDFSALGFDQACATCGERIEFFTIADLFAVELTDPLAFAATLPGFVGSGRGLLFELIVPGVAELIIPKPRMSVERSVLINIAARIKR